LFILVVKDERGALVSEHELEDVQLIVGRVGECDIVLASTAVSRQHACFFVDGDRVYVSDMGSANGVYVDEERIRGDVVVDSSSRIRLAEFIVSVEEVTVEARQPSGIITAVVAPEAAHGKLLILSGPEAGREILLYEPVISIGRIEENDVCLQDNSISRHHARLQQQDDGSYVLYDLGSSNGIYMMGRKITHPLRIVHGDRVIFGHIECLISRVSGVSRTRRSTKQWILYALLAIAAAALGAILAIAILK
jgi:pSer/pThr/pTyr-binding forkhead associated (FHA) protein